MTTTEGPATSPAGEAAEVRESAGSHKGGGLTEIWSPPGNPRPRRPEVMLPPGSCDAHCHVFGPLDRFPYSAARTFTPPEAGADDLLELHRRLGIDRAVVVQSSAHGSDHRALLHTLDRAGGRYRGVALPHPSLSARELHALADAGVRGARVHFMPHLGGAPGDDELAAVLRIVRDLGWHLELHVSGQAVAERRDAIARLGVPVVIDHLARLDLAEGPDSPSVHALLWLLGTGDVWVKVSGVDRVSRTDPPYADAVELARRLVRHAPDRVLWGTDYPHVNIVGEAPDDALLTELLTEIAPEPGLLRRLLVTNPAEFFGFTGG